MPGTVICPKCGQESLASSGRCMYCGGDLSRAQVSRRPAEAVVVCPYCGFMNQPSSLDCEECGFDLEGCEAEDNLGQRIFVLTDVRGQFSMRIRDSVIVGREGSFAAHLARFRYVSREQAVFWIQDGELYADNLSQTNPTFVNGEPVSGPVPLQDGDEIGLGGKLMDDGSRQDLAAYLVLTIR